MKQIVITIDIDHDELNTSPEAGVASILIKIKDAVLNGLDQIDGMKLRDINGNLVGISKIENVRW